MNFFFLSFMLFYFSIFHKYIFTPCKSLIAINRYGNPAPWERFKVNQSVRLIISLFCFSSLFFTKEEDLYIYTYI